MSGSVLIVDDDPDFRLLARSLLVDCGLVVVGEADSVANALSRATELEPSAVLVDVGLPDGDGVTLAHQLAALPWRPQVVLTSVDADVDQHDAIRHSRPVAFVHKEDPSLGADLEPARDLERSQPLGSPCLEFV